MTMLARIILLWAVALTALAEPIYEFDNPTDRERFKSFTEQMRCPKCQNQNLAGSDSMVASDLRRELYEQIQAGRSDKEIVDHMVARYGDYILYRPPLDGATLVLWATPAVLLLIGIGVLWFMVRRRRREDDADGDLNEEERRRLDKLMDDNKSRTREGSQ